MEAHPKPVSPRTYYLRLAVVAVVYALAAGISLYLVPSQGTGASLVWIPSAVGLAAVYFWGYQMWPALVLSFFAVLIARDIAPPLAVGVALGNTLEAVLGVYLLARMGFSPMFNRLRDSLGLILVSFISTAAAAVFITTSVFLFNGLYNPYNMPLFVGLWIGHAVSLLAFAPFLLRWLCRPRFSKTGREILEGLAIFGPLAVLSFCMYWTAFGSIGNISFIYISVPFYIWAALRTGPRGISLALAMTAIIAATGILFGWGPASANERVAEVLFGVQVLMGTISIIFLLFTSITEERQEAVINLEQYVDQLESAVERIQGEDQAKSDFIAILAHELRNPLSPILSGLEILKSRSDTPNEVVRMMDAHVHTIARLLDDLLDITRITQKKFKLERAPVELKTVIGHALEMVDHAMQEKNHTLTVTLPEPEIWLTADAVRLTQVFANILGNAARYTDTHGSIYLVCERHDTRVVVRIKDNGSGIAPERLPRVFDAFGGTDAQSRQQGGLGIGLSLAKRMVELHQGTIVAQSAGVGKGSEFTIVLPLTPVQMPLDTAAQPPRRARFNKEVVRELSEQGSTKILVCDDNRGAAQMLGKLLENNGHEVELAYNGAQALACAKDAAPRVALLDIGLPDMDGYELARKMKEMHPKAILVALTGYGQDSDKQKALDAGFAEHLVKPVSIVDVERVLSDLGIRSK